MAEAGRIATVGMFDGVHLGHQWLVGCLVDEGRRRNLRPAVFTFDRHPLQLIAPAKAPQALMTLDRRVEALKSAGADDVFVLEFDDELRGLSASDFIKRLRDRYGVEAILMGYNHRFGSDCIVGFERYRSIGESLGVDIIKGREVTVGEEAGQVSSSAIREDLRKGDVAAAAAKLGRSYSLSGEVVHGRAIGRSIGFPTANIQLEDSRLLVPLNGVYAADVEYGIGQNGRAMVNIGVRPTVDDAESAPLSIEAHIIGVDENLYGQRIKLDFLRRIRSERRFSSLEALRTQLSADMSAALQ